MASTHTVHLLTGRRMQPLGGWWQTVFFLPYTSSHAGGSLRRREELCGLCLFFDTVSVLCLVLVMKKIYFIKFKSKISPRIFCQVVLKHLNFCGLEYNQLPSFYGLIPNLVIKFISLSLVTLVKFPMLGIFFYLKFFWTLESYSWFHWEVQTVHFFVSDRYFKNITLKIHSRK